MPRARAGYTAPQARIPRTLFAHAHRSGGSEFPPNLHNLQTALAYVLIPDNWNGLDDLILWLLSGGTEQIQLNVTINIGSCDELFNVHTQTVNAMIVNMVNNEYECVELTTTHATVLANLTIRDMIQVSVAHWSGDNSQYYIGIELQET